MKPVFLKAGLLAVALVLTGRSAMGEGSPEKPNILFIMSDDHTSQAVGVYGGRLQKLNPTPVIDQLAREGIVMENAFCTNSICTPSRACIMTGQYSAVNRVTTLGGRLPADRQYLAIEMKKAGYETAVIGKWHLKELPETFDYYKVLPGQGRYFDPFFRIRGGTEVFEKRVGGKTTIFDDGVYMKGHSSDCITESCLDWLKEIRDPGKPFFLKMHFKAPHGGFDYAPRYEPYLADIEIPEPENLWESGNHGSIGSRGHNDELVPYLGTSVSPRNPRRNYSDAILRKEPQLSYEEVTRKAYQNYMKKYLRCVKGVDDNIGLVLDYLKKEGLLDNTVIIYTGDQGFYLGEHDFIDKRWGYEEGMRMPFVVRYPPGIEAGTRSDAIIENVDYPAMILEYAGVATPEYMQGKSFRSIMETGEEPDDWKQAAYYHYWMHMASHDNPGHIAIRRKKYKLIFFYGCKQNETTPETPPGWELYDLEKDPGEMNNLYDDPVFGEVVKELKAELKAIRTEYREDDPQYACNQVIEEYWEYGPEEQARAIEISHRYKQKKELNLMNYFMPMEPQGPLVSEGIFGVPAVFPRDPLNGLEDPDVDQWVYWDGRIVKGHDGRYHMYASRWDQKYPHGQGWKEGSKAIHAVSDDVMGPYEDTGLAWPHWQEGKGHNVIGLRMHDGRYAMVCSGITYGEVFVSDNPDGPWELLGQIRVDENGFDRGLAILSGGGRERLSNVSMILRPDGRYMIVPRSTCTMISDNGILGPYKIVHDRVYRKYPQLPQSKNEDPTVWYSGGMYHIVYNHWPSKTAYYFSSEDGIHDWTYRGIAFKKDAMPFRYTDGTVNDWSFIERPMAYVEEGYVTHFNFSVIDVKKGEDRGNDKHGSKIIIVPFDGKTFDTDIKKLVTAEKR